MNLTPQVSAVEGLVKYTTYYVSLTTIIEKYLPIFKRL